MATIQFKSPAFITTWETTTSDEKISFSTRAISDIGAGPEPDVNGTVPSEYDFTVKWGDGTKDDYVGTNPSPSHTYSDAGTYRVKIFAQEENGQALPNVRMNSDKLQTIEQWGSIRWKTMYEMFLTSSNVTYNANDKPNLSDTTNFLGMFRQCSSFNGDVSAWNMSNAKKLASMFQNAGSFNQDIGDWDVSNVTDMNGMFLNNNNFNQDISGWDVSSVTDMGGMFFGNGDFDQDLSGWDVSSVTNMRGMWRRQRQVPDVTEWDVSNVTDMAGMFFLATNFDQDISGWDVSNVTSMEEMFVLSDLNQNLGRWDVSNVKSMRAIFSDSSMSDENSAKTVAGWVDPDVNVGGNTEDAMETGNNSGRIELEFPSGNDYNNFSQYTNSGGTVDGATAIDKLCSDPPNWRIFLSNAPADC